MSLHPDIWGAQSTEVVVSGGDVLYIPGYWFHYIISQDASIQCNGRSGDSSIGREAISDCGFYDEVESSVEREEPSDRKDKQARRGRRRSKEME